MATIEAPKGIENIRRGRLPAVSPREAVMVIKNEAGTEPAPAVCPPSPWERDIMAQNKAYLRDISRIR